jgi:hypothetical protein
MPFNCVQIFLVGMRYRSEQFDEFTAGEGDGTYGDNLADWFAAAFHDESLVAISHPVHNF